MFNWRNSPYVVHCHGDESRYLDVVAEVFFPDRKIRDQWFLRRSANPRRTKQRQRTIDRKIGRQVKMSLSQAWDANQAWDCAVLISTLENQT